MKNYIKKCLCLLLSLVLLFSFSGCAKEETPSENQSVMSSEFPSTSDISSQQLEQQSHQQTSQQSQQQSSGETALSWKEIKSQMPASLKGSTVTMWCWNSLSDRPGASNVIAKFENETGIKVKFEQISGGTGEYGTKVAAAVASGTAPDVVRLRGYEMGILQSLQPVNKIKFNFKDKAWDSRVADFYTFGDNQYCVNMANTVYQQPLVLVYNKNLINKYALEDPYALWKSGQWTFEKFEELCKTFEEETSDEYIAWTPYQWSDIANWSGQSLIERKGDEFVANTTNPRLVKGYQTYANMTEKRLTTGNVRFSLRGFETGNILFFTEGIICARATHYYFKDLKKTGAIGAVPPPTINGGIDSDTALMGEYEAYGVPTGSKNPLGAAYFLRYFLDGDNYDKSTLFTDRTILDVYETLMSKPKAYQNSDYYLITADNGQTGESINRNIISEKSNQIQTKINEYANVVATNAKAASSIAQKLK